MTPSSATTVRRPSTLPASPRPLPPARSAAAPRLAALPLRAPAVSVRSRVHEDEHLLLWQVHGAAELVLGGEPAVLHAGSACWIPAGVVHSLAVRPDSVVLPLFFDATPCSPGPGWSILPISEELRPLLLLSMQYQNSIISCAEGREELEAQILDLVMSRSELPLPRTEPARSIAEQLRRDPGDPRTAPQLAAAAHVSARTLERAFLQETGLSLHQWRIEGRMQAATRLLREGVSVPAVAARVGYANVSAFGRVFKEHVGETPRRYARLHGACPTPR